MTKHEFNEEFQKKITNRFAKRSKKEWGTTWHGYIEINLHKLSKDALLYIVQNNDNYFFGDFIKRRALDLMAFELVTGQL